LKLAEPIVGGEVVPAQYAQ